MKLNFVKQPNLLLESIDLIYKYVNGISYDDIRNGIIAQYGSRFDDRQVKFIYDYTTQLSKLTKSACSEISLRDEYTIKLFSRLGEPGDGNHICMAKLMTYSFSDINAADFDTAAVSARKKFHNVLIGNYGFCGVASLGFVEYAKLTSKDPKRSLMDQIDTFNLPGQYKWDICRVFSDYDDYFAKLIEIVRPVVDSLDGKLDVLDSIIEERMEFWRSYLEPSSVSDFVESQGNDGSEYVKDEVNAVIWRIPCDYISAMTEPEDASSMCMYIGALVDPTAVKDSRDVRIDMIQRSLQVLSNKKRLEMLYLLKSKKLFGYEIARLVDLDATTVSRHMSALSASGLIIAQKGEGHTIYYTANKEKITLLLRSAHKLLIDD